MQSELSIVRPTAPVQGQPDERLRTQAPLTAREPLGRVDVAVVGGGLAGLAAAATAARTGRSVALYEGGSGIGGRARTRTEHGFHFNVGAHAIYQNGPGLRALRDLGVEPRGGSVNPAGSVAQRGGRLDLLPVDAGSFFRTGLLDASAKLDLAWFLGRLSFMNLEPLADLTVREWLDRAIRTDAARQVIEAIVRTATYSNLFEKLSAGAALRQLKIALGPVLYVHGGWQTFVDDLRERAQAFGARVVVGTRAEGVERQAGGWAVRLADGRVQHASAVVLAVSPDEARDLTGAGTVALHRWAGLAQPVRVASLDLGLRRLPEPKARLVFGIDRPLFLTVQSTWGRLAPEGGALIHVTRYLGDQPRGEAEDAREIEALLDRVIPGWRDEIVVRRFVPSLVVSHALPSVEWETQAGPAGPAVPGADGLFVAGDWVGPIGMIGDRALASGSRAGAEAAALVAIAETSRLAGRAARAR